ncbi:MAG: stage III sporulation protein AB [Oscillospiraceae bacterium]|nr:stage III sporulation protein AB [Oscillospiraceae bacterium]
MTGHVLGAALVTASGAFAGVRAAASLRRDTERLRRLESALGLAACELSVRATPLPELFELLAAASEAETSEMFARAALLLETSPVSKAWDAAVRAAEIPAEAKRILLPLGQVLGSCGAEKQGAELELARRSLGVLLDEARSKQARQSKVYPALGLCFGAITAVMLF